MAFSLKSTGLKQPEILDGLFANAQVPGAFGADVDLPPAVAAFLVRTTAGSVSAGNVLLALDDTSGEMTRLLICEGVNFFTVLMVDDVVLPGAVNGKFTNTDSTVFTASPFFLGQLPDTLFPRTKPVLFVAAVAPVAAVGAPLPSASSENNGKTIPEKENDRFAVLALGLLNVNLWGGALSDPRKKEVTKDCLVAALRAADVGFKLRRLPYVESYEVARLALTGQFSDKVGNPGFKVTDMMPDGVAATSIMDLEGYLLKFGKWLDVILGTGKYHATHFMECVYAALTHISSDEEDSLGFKLHYLEEYLCDVGAKLRSNAFANATVTDVKAMFALHGSFPKLTATDFSKFVVKQSAAAVLAAQAAVAGGHHRDKKQKVDKQPGIKVVMSACFALCAFEAKLDGYVNACSHTNCKFSHGPFTTTSASAMLKEFKPFLEKKFSPPSKCVAQTKKLATWMASSAGGFAK